MSARSFKLTDKRQGNIQVTRYQDGSITTVDLHNNTVVKHLENGIVLSSCGWRTVTTKTAINRYLTLINYPASVFQKKGNWYVRFSDGNETVFSDGMILTK